MEVFMTQMTDSLRNNFHLRSAIRHLFTPEGGTRVKKLDQIKDRGVYIASTKAKLEKADYSKNHKSPKKPKLRNIHTTYSKLRRDSEIYVKPVKHWDKAAEQYRKTPTDLRSHYKDNLSYYQTIKESTKPHIKTLYIFANGDTHRYYSVILRGKLANDGKAMECFQKILNQISTTVGRAQTRDRGSLAVRRLYNLDGKRVKNQSALHDGMAYICVGDPANSVPRLSFAAGKDARAVDEHASIDELPAATEDTCRAICSRKDSSAQESELASTKSAEGANQKIVHPKRNREQYAHHQEEIEPKSRL
jgi:hypothetical protein